MSPRDRMRSLAAESSATADHSHLAPLSPSGRIHTAIKAYYIGQGNTEQQWQAVSANLAKFNQVWRQMLRLPSDDAPPPKQWRLVLPFQSSIHSTN